MPASTALPECKHSIRKDVSALLAKGASDSLGHFPLVKRALAAILVGHVHPAGLSDAGWRSLADASNNYPWCFGKQARMHYLNLSGERFLQKWATAGRTADDLFYITRTSMPFGAPNSLSGWSLASARVWPGRLPSGEALG